MRAAHWALVLPSIALLTTHTCLSAQVDSHRATDGSTLVPIPGGTFVMGDARQEGAPNESPPHRVTLGAYLLGATEITVAQFAHFVSETGYRTSAEAEVNRAAQDSLMRTAGETPDLTPAQRRALLDQTLLYGGCGWWNPEKRSFEYDEHFSWRHPGFEQTDDHPAVCLSWDDAASYANWVSRTEGLAVAYDVESHALLDANGHPTTDVHAVVGYRLPTEAEWEYAAREGGKDVRFGNGLDKADESTAAFDASNGTFPYLTPGSIRTATMPVASYPPNALGLFDMAGNAWEWASDLLSPYAAKAVIDPYAESGNGRVVRGGRWGGSAEELRATKRLSWQANNRCNASGFRLARSN
jgi:formylglycine-generating enzyme required for sulfatase activity